MNESLMNYIIARLIDNANDCLEERKENPKSDFLDGKSLAYYEMLDTIKNELIAHDIDLEKFGLDIDLDKKYA